VGKDKKMVSGFVTLIIFIFALGGMIIVHELGHFIAARWAGIEVEEFGIGLPSRLFGFWRNSGYAIINNQRIEIPRNFDMHLDWNRLVNIPVSISVDNIDDKLVLRSLRYTEIVEAPINLRGTRELSIGNDGAVEQTTTNKKEVTVGKLTGTTNIEGNFSEIHAGTLFSMNWLLLGGFVRPKGENDPNVPGGLAAASPWKRLVVLFAGPIMNLLTAVVVFSMLVAFEGTPVLGTVNFQTVSENSPASAAGLEAGDILLEINGQKITDTEQAIKLIRANLDQPVELLIERDGRQMTLTATPLSTRSKAEGALGVGLGYPTRPATLVESISAGTTITALQAANIVYLPVALIQGAIAPEEARFIGFKGIFDMFDVAVEEDVSSRQEAASAPVAASAPKPTNWTLSLIGILSISLGVMNLFPIPALDGGRILFTLPEILFKKRIPPHWENAVNGIAMLLLIGLMLFVNVMDFVNPVQIPAP
jgi:regulator of sigma E protease